VNNFYFNLFFNILKVSWSFGDLGHWVFWISSSRCEKIIFRTEKVPSHWVIRCFGSFQVALKKLYSGLKKYLVIRCFGSFQVAVTKLYSGLKKCMVIGSLGVLGHFKSL
jgi:hypothetical protein